MSTATAFRRRCHEAVTGAAGGDYRLRIVGRKRCERIVDIIVSEWEMLQLSGDTLPRAAVASALRRNSLHAVRRQKWGFIPLPIILLVAEIILRIILAKWFSDA
jgi:hypothetical protein